MNEKQELYQLHKGLSYIIDEPLLFKLQLMQVDKDYKKYTQKLFLWSYGGVLASCGVLIVILLNLFFYPILANQPTSTINQSILSLLMIGLCIVMIKAVNIAEVFERKYEPKFFHKTHLRKSLEEYLNQYTSSEKFVKITLSKFDATFSQDEYILFTDMQIFAEKLCQSIMTQNFLYQKDNK